MGFRTVFQVPPASRTTLILLSALRICASSDFRLHNIVWHNRRKTENDGGDLTRYQER